MRHLRDGPWVSPSGCSTIPSSITAVILDLCAAGKIQVSRRDIPYVLANKLDGATTVSATMLLAAAAGMNSPVSTSALSTSVHRVSIAP